MCFSAGTILDWVRGLRAGGVDLPVKVGVPGAVETVRLLTMAGRIGVGDSLKYLSKNRGLFRMLRPGFRPERLVEQLARDGDGLGLAGLHVFTFNQVAATAAWHREAMARSRM
jgi:methylenetetrahydrofolate reductase (NADPH)